MGQLKPPSDAAPTDGQPPSGLGPHLDLDQRIGLLHEILSPSERHKALSHLADCPTCEEKFRRLVAHHERLRAQTDGPHSKALAANLSKFAARLPMVNSNHVLPPRPRPLDLFRHARRILVPLGLAAMASVAVMLLRSPDDLKLYLLPPPTSVQRGAHEAASDTKANLVAGLWAYADGNLDRAVELLREAAPSSPFENVRELYLGSALALSGHYAEASSVLLALDPAAFEKGYLEAHWALYVSLIRSGQDVRADSLLQCLAAVEGEVGNRARLRLSRK